MNTAPEAEFQPYDAAFAADPYPVYASLRQRTPIFRCAELSMTLVTRCEDIRALLLDSRLGRTRDHVLPREEVERQRREAHWERLPNYSRYVRTNLLETEGAEHARLRRVVSAALDPRRIRQLRSRVQQVVDEMLATLVPRGRMDFLEDLAVPLPVFMIAELLGWPAAERHRLRPWSADIVRPYERNATAADEARAEAATSEFAAMIGDLAEQRRAQPRDDLLSALAATLGRDDGLSRDEVIATCMLLLNAGHEATVNAAGNGLLALLKHPQQLERLRADPSLTPKAVEEIIRYDAPLQLFHRHVLEDVEIGGVRLASGDTVGLLYGSGNRDPAAFERVDEFDVGRQPNRHLGFGTGTHFCLGAPLARLELEVLFGTMLLRLPRLQLADPRPQYRTGLVFRGLQRLPVSWT